MKKPFNRTLVLGEEETHLREIIQSGRFCGDGEFTRRCNAILEICRRLGRASVPKN